MIDYLERILNILFTYRRNLPEADPEWPQKIIDVVNCIRDHLYDKDLSVDWLKEQCRINGNNFFGQVCFLCGDESAAVLYVPPH